MGQLRVRFSIEHNDEESSFTTLSDLKQHSFSDLILNRLTEFESQLKRTAADAWLHHKLGREINLTVQIIPASPAQDVKTAIG